MGRPFSAHPCPLVLREVAMTPGVCVEEVEDVGGGWLRPQP